MPPVAVRSVPLFHPVPNVVQMHQDCEQSLQEQPIVPHVAFTPNAKPPQSHEDVFGTGSVVLDEKSPLGSLRARRRIHHRRDAVRHRPVSIICQEPFPSSECKVAHHIARCHKAVPHVTRVRTCEVRGLTQECTHDCELHAGELMVPAPEGTTRPTPTTGQTRVPAYVEYPHGCGVDATGDAEREVRYVVATGRGLDCLIKGYEQIRIGDYAYELFSRHRYLDDDRCWGNCRCWKRLGSGSLRSSYGKPGNLFSI